MTFINFADISKLILVNTRTHKIAYKQENFRSISGIREKSCLLNRSECALMLSCCFSFFLS